MGLIYKIDFIESPKEDIKLTIKAGCATCGFEGFALGTSRAIGNTSGIVQLSSTGKVNQSNWRDNTLRCTAIVNGPDDSEVARTSLLRTSDYYVGIWKANAAPGFYKVSINASANGLTKVFADILEIEATG